MRCSVSPCSRASTVCMLMQLAHWLTCDARIFTNSIKLDSRLALISTDAAIQVFISCGAAAKGFNLAVMVHVLSSGPLVGVRRHDDPAQSFVTLSLKNGELTDGLPPRFLMRRR